MGAMTKKKSGAGRKRATVATARKVVTSATGAKRATGAKSGPAGKSATGGKGATGEKSATGGKATAGKSSRAGKSARGGKGATTRTRTIVGQDFSPAVSRRPENSRDVARMLRVALTGGIATGKSYVLQQFRQRGVPCLDADLLAHGVIAAGTEATAAIAGRFGREILAPDGAVDRRKLGQVVFADQAARRELEAIVHPAIFRAITAGLHAFELIGHYPLAIVDIPLLYETGRAGDFDKVIVTTCAPELQLARLLERGLTTAQARQRLTAQWPSAEKAARADIVITTDGSLAETDRQVERASALLAGKTHG
jgi:dephospho-CoA kinase